MCISAFPNSDLGGVKPVLAGHTMSSKDFQTDYLQKLLETPQTMCLFVQDQVCRNPLAVAASISVVATVFISGSHPISTVSSGT